MAHFTLNFETEQTLKVSRNTETPSHIIGVGRFRILGGGGLKYLGGQVGGGKFPASTCRRNDVNAT